MPNHIALDTETTGLEKCFCYDLGYIVFDDDFKIIKREHFIVEQIWHNLPLFESAYYKEKREEYVKLMRAKKATMDKWGYVMGQLRRDIKQYNVVDIYAYNSNFDDKVIAFNCDWFKTINPIETLPVYDIWGYASDFITNLPEYALFCELNSLFTDSGNYKGTAESVYQYLTLDNSFVEKHMGLYDALIEAKILEYCIQHGAKFGEDHKVVKVLPRIVSKPFTIKVNNEVIYSGNYVKKYVRNDTYNFTEPGA